MWSIIINYTLNNNVSNTAHKLQMDRHNHKGGGGSAVSWPTSSSCCMFAVQQQLLNKLLDLKAKHTNKATWALLVFFLGGGGWAWRLGLLLSIEALILSQQICNGNGKHEKDSDKITFACKLCNLIDTSNLSAYSTRPDQTRPDWETKQLFSHMRVTCASGQHSLVNDTWRDWCQIRQLLEST